MSMKCIHSWQLLCWWLETKKLPVSVFWSTNRSLRSSVYHEITPKNRFNLFLSMLHFCNNEKQPEGASYSTFQKLIQLLEGSLPFRNLYMGEQLSFWGKNCNRKHQLIFVLCDVKTGHVLDFVVQNTALKSKEEMELRQCSDCFHEAFASLWS